MAARGRFAPSPTGALHFGSLIAAVASFAQARSRGGLWLVRIEDLDRPREMPGASRAILRALQALGFEWDGPILYQSERLDAYDQALARLDALGLVYPCGCSRSEIAASAQLGAEGPIYAGICRNGLGPGRPARSMRLRVERGVTRFRDLIQGDQGQDVAREIGDFVLRRADGIHAYQLAVVLDDAFQGIDQVVRGADLLLSTPRQIVLQRALGLPTPSYAHVPLALDPQGRKLSKSLASVPVDPGDPLPALRNAWSWLGQTPPSDAGSVMAFWRHALRYWALENVPRRHCAPATALAAAGGGGLANRPAPSLTLIG